MGKRKRFIKSLNIQLDLLNQRGRAVYELIKDLKRKRIFTQTLYRALPVTVALDKRDTEPLFDMYPWLRDMIDAEVEARVNEHIGARFTEALVRLESLQLAPPRNAGLVPQNKLQPAKNQEDGIELTVTESKQKMNGGDNFLRNMLGLQEAMGTPIIVPGINDAATLATIGNAKPLAGAEAVDTSVEVAVDGLEALL